MSQVLKKLESLSLTLPKAAPPAANYVPFYRQGNLVHVSGQLPMTEQGLQFIGKVGREFTTQEGYEAAQLCALNILAQLNVATDGNLDAIKGCVELNGFVQCTDDFTQQPKVINGASDLMIQVFGDAGKHARAAVGVNALPRGVAVEIKGTFLV